MPDHTPYDEKEMLRKVALGEEPAFRELFEKYKQKIYSFALYLARSDAMAEEITQEIFIKVWDHRAGLGEIQYFSSWLRTLVRNHAYTVLRRIAREKLILQDVGYRAERQAAVTENDVLSHEYNRLLEKAIGQLPPRQQTVYLLSRKEGLKHEIIAERMGITVNTVKNHMKAALHSIRLFLEVHSDIMVLTALLLFFFD